MRWFGNPCVELLPVGAGRSPKLPGLPNPGEIDEGRVQSADDDLQQIRRENHLEPGVQRHGAEQIYRAEDQRIHQLGGPGGSVVAQPQTFEAAPDETLTIVFLHV